MDKLRYVVGDEIVYSICEPINNGISKSIRGPIKVNIIITDGTKDKFKEFIASEGEYKYATLVKNKVSKNQSGYLNFYGINFSRKEVEVKVNEGEEKPLGEIIEDEYLVNVITPMGDTEIAAIKVEDIIGL